LRRFLGLERSFFAVTVFATGIPAARLGAGFIPGRVTDGFRVCFFALLRSGAFFLAMVGRSGASKVSPWPHTDARARVPEQVPTSWSAMFLRIFSVVGTVLLVQSGNAQDVSPARAPWSLALSAHSGFIIAHSRKLVDVSGSKPFGAELDLFWTLADERFTRRSGLVARRGFALHAIDFDNPEVLGRVISLTPFVEPMIRAQDRFHGSVRLGVGFAWLNKVYDAETNPANLFFSTRLSFTGMVCANLGYRLSPHWEMRGGFNFNHISNAGMKEPNKGMNYPTWNFGAVYTPQPVAIQRPVRDDAWRSESRKSSYAMLSGTLKNTSASDMHASERTALAGAIGMVSWRTGRMSALSGGAEVIHDGFVRAMLDRVDDRRSAWKGALLAGPELLIGRVRFGVLIGGYVFNPSRDPGESALRRTDLVYQRYQLMYRFGDHLLVAYTLKAHRHVADAFDVRIGWAW
jgi:Lipid A 3-O-deacylase (PagL)